MIATRKFVKVLGGIALAGIVAGCGTSKTIKQGTEEFSINEDKYIEALQKRDDGEVYDALHAWQEVVDDEPRFAMGHFNLGLLYDQLEMIPEATHHYEQAVRLVEEYDNEKAAQARYNLNLGAIYLRQGLEHEAEAALAIAIRHDPYNAMAHYNISAAFLAQGNHDDAVLHADIAVDLTAIPDPKAQSGLDKSVDRNELSRYLLRQAECHMVRQEWAKARAALERSKNQCKVDPPAKMWTRLEQGEAASAEKSDEKSDDKGSNG